MDVQKQTIEWLNRINNIEQVSEDIIAFNFGIFENSEGYYSLYLTGSRFYDPEDDDWACAENFTPAERYLHLKGIFVNDIDWNDLLRDVKEILISYISSTSFKNSILKNAIAITVGFDDGELFKLPLR